MSNNYYNSRYFLNTSKTKIVVGLPLKTYADYL